MRKSVNTFDGIEYVRTRDLTQITLNSTLQESNIVSITTTTTNAMMHPQDVG